jgi:RimJ/RimL family protein N-acetyltransferase
MLMYKSTASIMATNLTMSFVNGYSPPLPAAAALAEDYGPDPYDVNFCFPLDVSHLESERVKLTPFVPRLHAKIYYDQIRQHPELHAWFAITPKSLAEILYECERFRQDSTDIVFAVIDKGTPDPVHPDWGGSMAGTLLLHTIPASLTAEIGWVVTFPAFQRTYVTSNATGILLRYCLATPGPSPDARHPGLGLRRVQWHANARNAPSVKAAQRLGFTMEAQLRWLRVLPDDVKSAGNGKAIRAGDPAPERVSRDDALLSVCADDWEDGGRELVQRLIDRKVCTAPCGVVLHVKSLRSLKVYRPRHMMSYVARDQCGWCQAGTPYIRTLERARSVLFGDFGMRPRTVVEPCNECQAIDDGSNSTMVHVHARKLRYARPVTVTRVP